MSNDLVELGFCTKPHGIKGAFSFTLFNTEDSVLKNGSELLLFPKDKSSSISKDGEPFSISKISFGNKTIVFLEGVDDRNVVEAMLPFDIFVDRSVFPELEEGEFYISDLVDAEVFDHESGEKIGIVKKIYDNGMQDIFVIGTYDHGAVELLNIEQFVPVIDPANKRIEVILPEVVSERS